MDRWIVYLFVSLRFVVLINSVISEESKELINVDSSILLLSLLDGHLLSINQNTGDVVWSLREDPILDVPDGGSNSFNFFPNPKDGSLYALNQRKDQLERLPLTIPELAQISPSRSSDGLLYTGKKSDTWLAIDPLRGTKLFSIKNEGVASSTCPAPSTGEKALFIARTAYTVTVYDGQSKTKRWNATYLEYNSHFYSSDSFLDLLYFSGTSDGTFVSVDSLTGAEIWRHVYESPVMAVYIYNDGDLKKIPLYSLAVESLSKIDESSALAIRANTVGIKATDANLRTSLFIGVLDKQIYAVDCFAKEEQLQIEFSIIDSSTFPLLEGSSTETSVISVSPSPETKAVKALGLFCLPQQSAVEFQLSSNKKRIQMEVTDLNAAPMDAESTTTYVNTNSLYESNGSTFLLKMLFPVNTSDVVVMIITVVVSSTLTVLLSCAIKSRWKKERSNIATSPHIHPDDPGSSATGSYGSSKSKNEITVGKITYFPSDVLGHGSHGTIVFKGFFEKRPVAIKRILPECFEMADQEVDLLQQSDHHPNVIRYFCMEQDMVFKYIALELCESTLQEYIERSCFKDGLGNPIAILHEAVNGLAHLHHLGIVHRDIKPSNVLISCSNDGILRAILSDFGLCRRLPHNRHSYTVVSGIAGTEGWIAPELFSSVGKVTQAVDIFSMGCVVYYVATNGCHPFGISIQRQANIVAGNYNISQVHGSDKFVIEDIVKKMISNNLVFRPTADEVANHCLFWTKEKQLHFFQDVSDRIEKESYSSRLLQNLEQNAYSVVGNNWLNDITEELRADLRKYRSYHGNSLRDLLRALRNKKHHYMELSEVLKNCLGDIPDGYVTYFTSRFPNLLIYVYNKMDICKNEPLLKRYF